MSRQTFINEPLNQWPQWSVDPVNSSNTTHNIPQPLIMRSPVYSYENYQLPNNIPYHPSMYNRGMPTQLPYQSSMFTRSIDPYPRNQYMPQHPQQNYQQQQEFIAPQQSSNQVKDLTQ